MGGCGCGCGGGHEPGCVHYASLIGTDVGMLQGDACGAGAANAPVVDIKCSLAAGMFGLRDEMQRLKAQLGGTPYRAWLVWEQQGDDGEYRDVRRVELMPVQVKGISEVLLEVSASGLKPEGDAMLVGVSPAQVTADDLLGRLEGRPWDEAGCRFFVEVVQHQLCAGRAEPTRMRFTPRGLPELRTAESPAGWMIRLTDQSMPRGRHGEDRTLGHGEQTREDRWAVVR